MPTSEEIQRIPRTRVHPDTLMDRHIAVTEALEPLLPLLDGALHFSPTSLCHGDREGQERLTDQGRAFVRIVRAYLDEAMSAARAVWKLPTADPIVAEFASYADDVWDASQEAALVAHALADPELPAPLSGHDGLVFIRERVRAATKAMKAMEAIADDATNPIGGGEGEGGE